MASPKVTLADIAAVVHLSPRAVSSALNGNGRISAEKRQKVLEVAQRLGYRPNIMARGLVKGKTFLLGVVLQTVHESFAPEVLQGIEDQAQQYGYRAIVCSTGDSPQVQNDHIHDLLQRGVDGIIIDPACGFRETYQQLESSGVPHVMVFHTAPPLSGPLVCVNNIRGGYLATRYFIERIGIAPFHLPGPEDNQESDERKAGFRKAIEEAGLTYQPKSMVYPSPTVSWDDGKAAIHDLADRNRLPRAVFAVNDYVALGALRAAHERGIKVPKELAVIGFDDLNLASWQAGVRLSTIRQPKQAIGELAMRMLYEQMAGGKVHNEQLEPELVLREST